MNFMPLNGLFSINHDDIPDAFELDLIPIHTDDYDSSTRVY